MIAPLIAISLNYFMGVPLWLAFSVICGIQLIRDFKKRMSIPDREEIHQSLDKNSNEYLSRYMPKN